MATVEVATWAELKAALQNSSNDGNTIKLTADIDMNEVSPSGDNIVMSYGSSMTLDGDNHVIRNLRTKVSSPAHIFGTSFGGTGRTFTIRNLDFVNLILAGASLIGPTSNQYPTTTVFENVGIVGSRSGAAYLFAYNGGITLSRCTIELPWKGTGTNLAYTSLVVKQLGDSPTFTDTANYCRFIESYGGWTVPSEQAGSANDTAFLTCSYFKLNGCRIEGNAKLATSNTNSNLLCILNWRLSRYTPTAQNVCDVDFNLTGTYNYVKYYNFSGVIKKSFTKTDGTQATGMESGASSGWPIPIFADAAQMKDASWLSGQGFDIIVPSE